MVVVGIVCMKYDVGLLICSGVIVSKNYSSVCSASLNDKPSFRGGEIVRSPIVTDRRI